jgi:hypothetical protein
MSGSCGIPYRPSPKPCVIGAEVKNRSGTPRWWCTTHGCEAWGPGGEQLPACAGASLPLPTTSLNLDPRDYAGGIALWGAVQPVYAWGVKPDLTGIHVHARRQVAGQKVIDATFEESVVTTADGPWRLTANMAVAYLVSHVLDQPVKALRCPRCNQLHLDMMEFAVTDHRKHQCNSCGRHFFDSSGPSIANPCVDLQRLVQPRVRLHPTPASDTLRLRQRDLSGLAIWGSNEAIIWTAPTAERTGIHVHAFDLDGQPVADDTYGTVIIDGHRINPDHIRLLMVQQALPFLAGRVEAIACQACGTKHYDSGVAGARPTAIHECANCRTQLTGSRDGRKVVSNPAIDSVTTLGRHKRGRRRKKAA